MKFSNNEKMVLMLLLDNARMPDADIGRKLKISAQAAGKIRKKLEKQGIIESYSVNLNFEKMGLTSFALVLMQHKSKFWKNLEESGGREAEKKTPQIIFYCRLQEYETSFIALHCFRNQKEMDKYFHNVQTEYNEYVEVKRIFAFSNESLIKLSTKDIFKHLLEDKEIKPKLTKSKKLVEDYFGIRS
jgi:DNA-binding Lrp family transcriptional regulator